MFNPSSKRFIVTGLFDRAGEGIPNYFRRIDDTIALGRVNIIIIDGKTQTGKSTLGRKICSMYDKDYVRVWTTEDILKHLKNMKEAWLNGDKKSVYGRWILFEEPQLEAPRQEYWNQRNMIIQMITSSYGFLKQHMILTLPNVKGISDVVLTNVSLRITVRSNLNRDRKIERRGYVKIPIFNEMKNKYMWICAEEYKIPLIDMDSDYDSEKANNFFNTQLEKWEKRLTADRKMYDMEGFFTKQEEKSGYYITKSKGNF